MNFEATLIPGVFLIQSTPAQDDRGSFTRTFCAEEFLARGLNPTVAQSAQSFNRKRGTLRGMHYQIAPAAEAKVVRCVRGAIFDVVADMRHDSPTYLKWAAWELTAANRMSVYVPEGCAHGLETLEDESDVLYLISKAHAPDLARGFRFDDPAVGIQWPLPPVVISAADRLWAPLIRPATENRE